MGNLYHISHSSTYPLIHSLQSLDLLQEVADEDVDGGVLLRLPVSQYVLEIGSVDVVNTDPVPFSMSLRLTFKKTLRSRSESMSSTSSRSISMSSFGDRFGEIIVNGLISSRLV